MFSSEQRRHKNPHLQSRPILVPTYEYTAFAYCTYSTSHILRILKGTVAPEHFALIFHVSTVLCIGPRFGFETISSFVSCS